MSFLLGLGKYLYLPLITEWLFAESLCALDTALCNRYDRKMFFADLAKYNSALKLHNENVGIESMRWLESRSCFIDAIEFCSFSTATFTATPIYSYLKRLTCLKVSQQATNVLINVIETANKLEFIRLCNSMCDNDLLVLKIGTTCIAFLSALHLENCWNVSGSHLHVVARSCIHLQSLTITVSRMLSDKNMLLFLDQNPKMLTSLNVSGCFELTDKTVLSVASHCPSLRTLNIAQCFHVTDVSVKAVALGCPSLTDLVLNDCTRVTGQALLEIATHCKGLRKLHISNLSNAVTSFLPMIDACKSTLTDFNGSHIPLHAFAISLANSCSHIQVCNLSYNQHLSDNMVVALSLNCPGLVSLSVHSCGSLTDKFLVSLAENNPNLTTLQASFVGQITDTGLTALSEGCVLLRHLDVGHCTLLTDEALVSVALHCSNLEVLVATRLNITDTAVQTIGVCCSALKELVLMECLLLSSDALEWLLQKTPKANTLQKLNVTNCGGIKVSTCMLIADRFPKMVFICSAHRLNPLDLPCGTWPCINAQMCTCGWKPATTEPSSQQEAIYQPIPVFGNVNINVVLP